MKIVSKNGLDHKQLISPKSGELYSSSHVVSEFFGSNQVFLTHDIITPHKRASSAHRHTFIEEVVFISIGQLTVIWGDQKETVDEGSFIFFDPKESELHCLLNESDSDVETVTFSIKRQDDVVIYDNNKVWQPARLETSRLILRPIQMADPESIFSYARNPDVSKYSLKALPLQLRGPSFASLNRYTAESRR